MISGTYRVKLRGTEEELAEAVEQINQLETADGVDVLSVDRERRPKDLPEDFDLKLDDYERHILWRAVRLYIAVNDAEREDIDTRDPDYQSNKEMTDRAKMLRDRITLP